MSGTIELQMTYKADPNVTGGTQLRWNGDRDAHCSLRNGED
jgi:hypothetical protein